MQPTARVLAASALALALMLAPAGRAAPTAAQSAPTPMADGTAILAVVGRQVAWLNLEAPRPRVISRIPVPANALEVAALPDASGALVTVAGPFPGSSSRGADLFRLDVTNGDTQPFLTRTDSSESLHSPVWWPDQYTLIFERQDLLGQPIGPPGQEVPRLPSRIERIFADGSGRDVLLTDGRQPAPSPDGSRLVFARTTHQGASLLAWNLSQGSVQVLVPEGRFADLAYPHVSPTGDMVVFAAPQSGLLGSSDWLLGQFIGPSVALAHGIPWDPWIVNLDGSGLRRLAETSGDEPSVTWSPDGSAVFVFSGTGSFIVDVASGAVSPLRFVQGYGPAVWLPISPG